MDKEFQELLRAFREYNDTLRSAVEDKTQSVGKKPDDKTGEKVEKAGDKFDKSTTKIVAALGVLNSSVLASSKTEVAKKRELEKFLDNIESSTKAYEKHTEQLEKNRIQAEKEEKVREAKRKKDEDDLAYANATDEEKKRLDKEKIDAEKKAEKERRKQESDEKAAANKKNTDDRDNAARAAKSFDVVSETISILSGKSVVGGLAVEAFTEAISTYAKSMEEFMGALYKGTRGMAIAVKPATEGLTALVDGVKTAVQVLTIFTPIGRGLKLFYIGLTEVVAWFGKRALKTVDASAEQLDALYKAYGELSASGAGAAGGLEAVRDSAQSLGFTIAELDEYSKLIAANSKSIKMFGVTVADGTKTLANMFQKVYNSEFGTELENMGIFQKEQRENALTYMEIQARTGNLQKANAKGLVEFNRQLDLSAAMTGAAREEAKQADLASKADPRLQAARRVAVEKDDKQEIARIDSITKAARLLEMIGDKGAATGARQFGAGGYAGGQGAIEAARQYGINNLKGGETEEQIMKMMREASVENRRLFDNITRFTGPLAGLQTADAEKAGLVEKTAPAEQAIKEGKAKDYSDFYKQEQEKRAAAKDVQVMNDLRRTQQETAMLMDNSVNIFKGAATLFAESSTKLASTIADLTNKGLNATIGGPQKSWNKGGYKSGAAPSTGGETPQPVASTPAAKIKQGMAESSNAAASNEAKSGRIGKSEAAAVLESGSKRDIEAFGGREALEKIVKGISSGASTKTAPASGPVSSSNSTSTQSGSTISGMASDLSKLFSFGSQSGSEDNFKKLDPSFKEKVIAAATEYNNLTGKKLTVNSAWRSREDQERLYNNKKPGQTVAKPGTSRHEQGLAVDIQESSDPVLQKIMNDLGVNHGYGNGNKNVSHFQARNGGIFKGPTTGYNVELHGEEAVVPLNGGNTVTKQALPMGMGNDDRSGEMISLLQMLIGQNETVISLLDNGNDYTKKLVSVMS
jgi:hypothetical protein